MTGTHAGWHPGEDDDYLSAAIDRVREGHGMSNTGVKREWYLGGGEYTERELVGIYRRAARRAQTLAEYHAEAVEIPTHGFNSQRPKTTVRVCQGCGVTYIARSATSRYHDPACQRAAQRARDKARKDGAA